MYGLNLFFKKEYHKAIMSFQSSDQENC